MPNHCENVTLILGSESELKRILEIVTVEDQKDPYTLSNLLPCPEELKIDAVHIGSEPPESYTTWLNKGEIDQTRFDELVQQWNQDKDLQDKNVEKYGYKHWYDWCIYNWGTKWGDYDHFSTEVEISNESIEFRYMTAWGPFSDDFWIQVSKKFPECTFITSFSETGMCFVGAFAAKNGICEYIYEDIEAEFPDYEDEDDFMDASEEFQDRLLDQRERIEAKVLNDLENSIKANQEV